METLVLVGVLVATVLVMASGVWVAWALITAVWRAERHSEDVLPSNPGQDAHDPGRRGD